MYKRDYDTPVRQAIENGDVDALLSMWMNAPCACLGARDGEPKCPCRMRSAAVRKHVNTYALTRLRKIVKLSETSNGEGNG